MIGPKGWFESNLLIFFSLLLHLLKTVWRQECLPDKTELSQNEDMNSPRKYPDTFPQTLFFFISYISFKSTVKIVVPE